MSQFPSVLQLLPEFSGRPSTNLIPSQPAPESPFCAEQFCQRVLDATAPNDSIGEASRFGIGIPELEHDRAEQSISNLVSQFWSGRGGGQSNLALDLTELWAPEGLPIFAGATLKETKMRAVFPSTYRPPFRPVAWASN